MSECLNGKRVLVVEDEYFIASDLRRALDAENAVVVGPVANLEKGLALIEEGSLDAAVLDVNLMGARSFPLADKLNEQNVPFIFMTGYDSWALPENYRARPRISKPFTTEAVVGKVEQLIEEHLI